MLCHCERHEPCHGDALLELLEETTGSETVKLPYREHQDFTRGNAPDDPVLLDFIDDGLESRHRAPEDFIGAGPDEDEVHTVEQQLGEEVAVRRWIGRGPPMAG